MFERFKGLTTVSNQPVIAYHWKFGDGFAHLDADRVMHRVTLLGPVPIGPDGFSSELVAGEPMRAW